MITGKLKWYYSRLNTMGAAELLFRGRQIGQRVKEKIFTPEPGYSFADIKKTDLQFSFFDATVEDQFFIFGKELLVNNEMDFHKDIFSGKSFPLSFSKTIDIRSDKFGSAKVAWEVNRLQFLIPLLIKYKKTGDKSLLDEFVSIITLWNEQNPYLKGINWYSNIEVNIRLVNWYWCWLLLENDAAWENKEKYQNFRNDIWLPLIYKHCCYSAKNPSYYSSANNHLIAEYTGLFMASTLWEFKESKAWQKKAIEGLEKEICKQHSEHGVNKEEAAAYIQFITDFFLLAYIAGQHHGIRFSKQYNNRLISIFSYINNILDVRGNIPRYGDDDDGRVIIPDGNSKANNFVSILNTASVLFNKPEWKQPGSNWDTKSHLLTAHVNGKSVWKKAEPVRKEPGSAFYKEEGHFILRKRTSQNKEIFCHFDAARLGYLSIAAHGHADALSIILHVNGYPFLVDPGTYAYHTHSSWRKYFAGTLAHNTITIDNTDQATMAGPTLWLNHFKCSVINAINTHEKEIITACHDGYRNKGITHKRTLIFEKEANAFELTDMIWAQKTKYLLSMPFHLHPHVSAECINENTWLLTHKKTSATVEIVFDPALTITKIDATEESTAGWYSESFMEKEKSSVLMGEYLTNKRLLTLHTRISILDFN